MNPRFPTGSSSRKALRRPQKGCESATWLVRVRYEEVIQPREVTDRQNNINPEGPAARRLWCCLAMSTTFPPMSILYVEGNSEVHQCDVLRKPSVSEHGGAVRLRESAGDSRKVQSSLGERQPSKTANWFGESTQLRPEDLANLEGKGPHPLTCLRRCQGSKITMAEVNRRTRRIMRFSSAPRPGASSVRPQASRSRKARSDKNGFEVSKGGHPALGSPGNPRDNRTFPS